MISAGIASIIRKKILSDYRRPVDLISSLLSFLLLSISRRVVYVAIPGAPVTINYRLRRNQVPEANAPFSSSLIFLRKGTIYSRIIDSRKNFSSSLSSTDYIVKNYISCVIRRRTIL